MKLKLLRDKMEEKTLKVVQGQSTNAYGKKMAKKLGLMDTIEREQAKALQHNPLSQVMEAISEDDEE